MLFHTQLFILLFFPVVWGGWRLLNGRSVLQQYWLISASFLFFGWWDWRFVPLLAGSILVNWVLARNVSPAQEQESRVPLLAFGVTLNLGILFLFKYMGFASETAIALGGLEMDPIYWVLPIGISFYTFQQISYLVDRRYRNAPQYGLRDYALYVSFFPQLIAGPIVRHNELIPQFSNAGLINERSKRLAQGITLFVIGVAKKVLIADQLAPHADAVFAQSASTIPAMIDAWSGLIAFSLQIYFDFSAYSDMAIGLALCFGFKLPINFNAPYRARSMRDFWRRWHITLSTYFRDYLYIPLGGNRYGVTRQYLALATTMGLCGLWHGAGWPFLLWGLWHGAGLIINHGWNARGIALQKYFGWALTLFFVCLGWVLFRSPDAATMLHYYEGLFSITTSTDSVAVSAPFSMLALASAIVFFAPTSQSIAFRYLHHFRLIAIGLALLLIAIVLELGPGKSTEFIYFQF